MSGHHRSLPLYCVIGADALSRAGNAMTTIAIPLIVLNQGYSAALLYGRADSVPRGPGGHRHSGIVRRVHQPDDHTILYALIPGDIRARTLGALTAAVTAGMPFGSVLAGYLGQSMTLPMAFAIIGGCYAGVFALTGFGRHWRKFNESFRHATEV